MMTMSSEKSGSSASVSGRTHMTLRLYTGPPLGSDNQQITLRHNQAAASQRSSLHPESDLEPDTHELKTLLRSTTMMSTILVVNRDKREKGLFFTFPDLERFSPCTLYWADGHLPQVVRPPGTFKLRMRLLDLAGWVCSSQLPAPSHMECTDLRSGFPGLVIVILHLRAHCPVSADAPTADPLISALRSV